MRHHYFMWILGGEPLLNDFGWELSAEDRNCFMHALNGNHSITDHEQITLLKDFQSSILYIMESLKDAPQITIDSFFEVQENCFLIWIFSESLLRTYGVTITDHEREVFHNALHRAHISREQRNHLAHALHGNHNLFTTRGQAKEQQETIFADPHLLQHFMDGTNYTTWEYPMRAYLKFKGYWLITVEGLPDIANQETPFWYIPQPKDSEEEPEESWESKLKRQELKDKYYNLDDGAKAAIEQRLTNAIIEEIWKYLKTKYNKVGSALVFGDIQKVYNFQIRGNQNPESEIA
ncbi:hypothetical protein AMATHDRAFT_10403 [Amanita thiersii Skay4041]|uniref:Uncharacterized protein n=1 Tax=Amanita thiersii Skay4041 TaxID=703135 RepID=A0A2A9NB55_9AGAR|nr:hypothetical protein AMATHDRAFT_10403 [Amanita thiersii Skay4041]